MTYKLDLFAIFIFLGIVQAVFLSVFFFSKENRKTEANVYQGILVLAMAANTFEIFLCYTGYILKCLWLVDFSESLAFVMGPAFYLLLVSYIKGATGRSRYYHFIVPLLWLILQIPFLIQSDDIKFNAWIGAYHPAGLDFRDVTYPKYFFNPPNHTQFILLHLTFYTLLGLFTSVKTFREKKESFWKTQHPTFKKLRSLTIQIIFIILLVFVVKFFNRDDTGDHLFATYITIAIYLISFQVVRQSGFFKQSSLAESQKYKTSSMDAEQQSQLLARLKEVMRNEKPFMQSQFSMPDLADRLKVSVHQLSQAINDGLGRNFFEMTAEHRIEEAKRLLKEKSNIKVEEIAEEVGYNSKSSFNTAFKKLTGMTPSEWRNT
jgi:AraC-like DNA-binding protein